MEPIQRPQGRQPLLDSGSPAADLHRQRVGGELGRPAGHLLVHGQGEGFAGVPVPTHVAKEASSSSQRQPEWAPAKANPLGALGALVAGGPRRREIACVVLQPAQVVQGSQLDVEVTATGCPLLCCNKQRPRLVPVVNFFDQSQGDQHVGLVTGAGHPSSHAQGLLAPATSLIALAGIDQRLGQGSSDTGPQRRRWLLGHQLDCLPT